MLIEKPSGAVVQGLANPRVCLLPLRWAAEVSLHPNEIKIIKYERW